MSHKLLQVNKTWSQPPQVGRLWCLNDAHTSIHPSMQGRMDPWFLVLSIKFNLQSEFQSKTISLLVISRQFSVNPRVRCVGKAQ